MRDKKKVTIYDIAKALEYSTSTISRALNGNKGISQKTIKEIKKVADEMGYRPNKLAASLRSNKTKTIGVLISRIDSVFMSSLISGVERTAQKAGYHVIIAQSHDSYEEEVHLSKVLYDNRVSGVICSLAMHTHDSSHFQKFIDQNIPLVFVDRVPNDISTYRVGIDNYTAGYRATKHLIEQGCQRIAHFGGSQIRNVYSERQRGYIDALKEHNLKIDEGLIVHLNSLSYKEGKKATRKLLDMKNPPDGIFSANDASALGAIQSAKKLGFKIPENLAVIGFNNDPMASIIDPGLSSITHPAVKMGQLSAKKVLSHLMENKQENITEITILETEVVIRGSSQRKSELVSKLS